MKTAASFGDLEDRPVGLETHVEQRVRRAVGEILHSDLLIEQGAVDVLALERASAVVVGIDYDARGR